MLNLLIRLAALMGSYFGWWEFFRRRWKINVYFLPAFTLAVHFTLLFLPGLFNFLEEASLALYFGGVVLALDALRREKGNLFKPYLNIGYAAALLLFAFVALGVRGCVFTWFDNFTHWATVVKNMLLYDRFPTFAQRAVGFPSYPLGSSTLIYYICNVTSDGEFMQMLAQGFLNVSMLLPAFAYVKKHPVPCGILALVMSAFLLGYNIPIQELLVDTLLPLAFTAAILFLRQEYHQQKERSIWLSFPFLFWMLNIKNASLFFLAVALVLLLLWHRQAQRPAKEFLWLLFALAVGYFLWDRHCDYVFVNSDMTQHAISAAYLKGRLSEKTPAVMWEIIQGVFRFAFTRQDLPWVLGAVVLLDALTWTTTPQLRREFDKLAAFLVSFHLLYTLSLAGMYVFSMSAEGALGLESIERYMRTADIVVFYLLLVCSFRLADQARTRILGAAAALLVTASTLGMWVHYGKPLLTPAFRDQSLRQAASDLIAEYGVAPGHAYLLLCPEENRMINHYIYRYSLNSPDVIPLTVTDESQLDAQKDYQYILITDEDNPVIQAWIQEHYPNQAGQRVIQDF